MANPLVSIIIPCHNDGTLLLEALASARAQTLTNCEIVIADDHSSDINTLNILKKLHEEGVNIVKVPDGHTGLPAARNCAVAHSRGKYILPLDADDLLAEDYARLASEELERQPDTAVCYAQAELFGLRSGLWRLESYSYPRLLCENMIFCSAMYRRSDFEKVGGYDERLRLGYEDWAFWIKLLEGGRRVVQLDSVLFYYRIREASLSASMRKRRFRAIFAVWRSCRRQYLRHLPLYILMKAKRILKKSVRHTAKMIQNLFSER